MTGNARSLLRSLLPPALAARLPKAPRRFGFFGDYENWAQAAAASGGYDQAAILNNVLAALRKVRDGEAACERDSCLFDTVQYAWPLLAGINWAAARNGGMLDVLDFGGSLGSLYFQCRSFLGGLRGVRWGVVEQPDFVEAGRREFEDGALCFFESLGACAEALAPKTAIFSSVLQYVEKPYEILAEARAMGCTTILVDRTPFIDGPRDRLCIQKVDPALVSASYPSWLFSEERFRAFFGEGAIVADFAGSDFSLGLGSRFKGFIIDCGGPA